MTLSYSAHFRVPIPDFLSEPWHAQLQDAIRALDTAIYDALLSDAELWANSHAYTVGSIVIGPEDGLLWTCAIAHTSPATPTTFTTFVGANPTYWNRTVTIPQQRGTWQTATSYIANDFVIESGRYAVCIVSHVSGTFNTDLAAGKWVVLIDTSSVGAGINTTAEASTASATTTDIGAVAATRQFITGTTTITSFGAAANQFKVLRYEGAVLLTNSADIILLGAANRTTRAGDMQFLSSSSTGKWREISYFRADGNPATATERGLVELATDGETTTGTDTARATTPANVKAAIDARFFPSGTRMLFQQTAAPTGWTKDTTKDNNALRIVSGTVGSGGSVNFSTVFGLTATDNYTLTQANLPNVSFTHSGTTLTNGGHTHFSFANTSVGSGVMSNVNYPSVTSSTVTIFGQGTAATIGLTSSTTENTSVNTQGSAASGGSGTGHSHTIDLRVKYVDFIIAQKD